MSEVEKKLEGIRDIMSVLKCEKYAITNKLLEEQNEYIKSLYMKVLCTVIQYKNEPTEMQLLFVKRIMKCIGLEEKIEEYMKKALDISETDIQEFLSNIGSNELKYYFALDGIMLIIMGKAKTETYEYLAEIIELLNVLKNDLEYVCLVAKSVLLQQSSYYDEAKQILNERMSKVDFFSICSKILCRCNY